IHHRARGVFAGIPNGFNATRYHSLIIDRDTLPDSLVVTAETVDGVIMGLEHKTMPVYGVQFHPESIASEHGRILLKNFIDLARSNRLHKGRAMTAFKELSAKAATGAPLSTEEAAAAFDIMMSGDASPAQMGGFLTALRVRGETVDEIAGGAMALTRRAHTVAAPEGAIDTCGTGGDAAGTFNISTAAAIVTAACGVAVAKHGNRAVSSKSGSADVLSALGINIDAGHEVAQRSLMELGITFLMAPRHHAA